MKHLTCCGRRTKEGISKKMTFDLSTQDIMRVNQLKRSKRVFQVEYITCAKALGWREHDIFKCVNKATFGNHHSNSHFRQETSMDPSIRRCKFDKEQRIGELEPTVASLAVTLT